MYKKGKSTSYSLNLLWHMRRKGFMNSRLTHIIFKGIIIIILICLFPVLSNAQLNVNFTFSPDNACSGTSIQFTSTVTGGGSSPYIYSWNFGDANTSNVANPNHVYNAFGCDNQLFNVVLTVTDTSNGGNVNGNKSNTVTVKKKPDPQLSDLLNDPDFSNCDNNPTPANPNFPIQVQNITQNSTCISTYTINWGDGSPPVINLTNSSFPISYTYLLLGAFNLTIMAYGSNGCSGMTSYIVKNQSNPAVGISTSGNTQGCQPKVYSFTISNYALNSPGTTYLWDFGDNSPTILWTQDSVVANNATITHTFTTTSCGQPNNEFIVSVTASNSCSSTSATVSGIKIWSSPIANFSVNPLEGCINSTCFSVSNTTIPGGYGSACSPTTTYLWDFGDGQTSTLQNPPCHTYSNVGTYTITLTASNGCGSTIMTKEISVQSPPTAIATLNQNTGCVPFQVIFTNTSTGTNIQFTWSVSPTSGWSFINNTNNHSQNPVIQFTIAGTYTVTLTVTNSCGSDTESFSITAKDKPSITIPTIMGDCNPYTYVGNASYITNGSNISSYNWSVTPTTGWNFVAPSNSGSQNPTILFTQSGIYQITVQATNECGTTSQISNQFEVASFAQVSAGNDTSVCLNSGNFQLIGNPSGGSWSGSYVSSSGIFSPTAVGNHTSTYSKGGGNCLSQDQVIVTVLALPSVNAGIDQSICFDHGQLTLSGSPAGGIWSGTGIINNTLGVFDPNVSGVGTFTITYTFTESQSHCTNSDAVIIVVFPLPNVIADDVTLCNQPIPEQLVASPSGGTWSGLNVTPTGLFTPNGTGNFTLLYSYTDNNSCNNSDSMIVIVIDPDTTVNAGNDTSICSNESIYLVGHPPGGTWSGQNITPGGYFDPISPGNYSLRYSLGIGSCLTADTTAINVRAAPEAGFDYNTVCFGETTNFNDQSSGGGSNLSSWFWKFGDNNTSQSQNPSNTYLTPGNFDVTLIVTSVNGCIDSIVRTIQVMPLPTVSFNVNMPACVNMPVYFNNNCINAQSYLWNFGDGATSSQFEPTHTYLSEGTYLVVLVAASSFGCTESDSMEIFITGPPPLPHFDLTPKEGCSPLTIYFSIDSTYYDDVSSYHWDFGNGITSNELIPPDSLIYSGSLYGDTVYYISFASFNFCAYLTYSDSILVHPKPLSAFEMLHDWDCTPVEVQFKNFTRGLPDSFYWELGDGTTTTEFEPLHTYTTGNSSTLYTIKLNSSNACGTDTLSRDLLVKPNTVDAFFSVDKFKGCEKDTFYFSNFSTDTSSIGIFNISWDFGDGQGSSLPNPYHIYNQEGTFIVRLHVDNGCGHDDMYDSIFVNPNPQITIHMNNEACVGEILYFDYTSDIEIAGKIWYFGDGDSSVLSNPNHAYQQEGIYEVILSGLSAYGFPICTGVAIREILIKPTPAAHILPDTAGCAPLLITFQGDSGSYHLWNFGENELFISNPTHVFENPGLYTVSLISENNSMCRDMDSIAIRVFPHPESQFTFTSSGGYPELLTFINISTGATECFWDFGNGLTSTSWDVPEPIEYSNNGNYIISLVTLNQYGCFDTTEVIYPVTFKGLFVPNAFAPEHPDPGVNLFLPKGIGLLDYTIQVYDTWGNLIWQSTELDESKPSEGWDGRNENGELYPQDVYVWKIIAKFYDGIYWSNTEGKNYGTVTLIR
jgi:PKD repeat protein